MPPSTGNESMRELVQVVNRLQDACLRSQVKLGLELPQICVVGGQSVGKSSVLESIVGKDFLPRGSGIVTRCPLILQCKHSDEDYAEFFHLPGQPFYDFEDVRQEIEKEMNKQCGRNKGITDKPISLAIYSKNVLDLTLVDLPGITRVPVGDQPADIDQQTMDLVLEHVKHPNVIILAVSAANVDLANSDAMKVVKKVDPTGKRTIGVLTKLDIMGRGTDARPVLLNEVFPLHLGYIGIVNRDQEDIDNNVPIAEIREKEARFFNEHSSYSDLAGGMGVTVLQRVLNRVLSSHIEKTLPSLLDCLRKKKTSAADQLSKLQHTNQPNNLLTRCINEYVKKIQTEVGGNSVRVRSDAISGGARIKSLFTNEFAQFLDLTRFLFSEREFNDKVEVIIQNIRAINHGIFIPDLAFNALASDIIERFKEPVIECVEMAGKMLRQITDRAAETMDQYPHLHEAVVRLMSTHIAEQENETKRHLLVHVDAECSYQNTMHEDYLSTLQGQPEFDNTNGVSSLGDHKGKVHLKVKGKETERWFVVTPNIIKCFKNEMDDEVLFLVNMDKKLKIKREITSKEKKLILSHSEGKNLAAEHRTLELTFKDETYFEKWTCSFLLCGVTLEGDYVDVSDSSSDTSSVINAHVDASVDPRTRSARRLRLTKVVPNGDEVETVKQMVKAYVAIVSKTILDIVPKYIVHLLVRNTETYTEMELLPTLTSTYDAKTLLERDPLIQHKIDHLSGECATTDDAIRIIQEYYKCKHTAT